MKSDKEEKFSTLITGLSSAIVSIVLVGLFAFVLIYHTTVKNLAEIGDTNLMLLSIIIGLANTIGVVYIITQLIRIQAGVNGLKHKSEEK